MKAPTKQAERHVDAVMAALDLMDCFLDRPILTIRQLMEKTGYTRNRVMRITGTLLHKAYLTFDPETGHFSPGLRLWALGRRLEPNQGLAALVRPALRKIAMETGESVSFYVREGMERVVLAREEGTHAIRYTVVEGQRMDLHAGAGGKVLLAYAPKEVREAVFSTALLPRRTDKTIVDGHELKMAVKTVKANGFALSEGERVADAVALSTPVFDRSGTLQGALGIAGPMSRITPEIRDRYLKRIRSAASEISGQLGWPPLSGTVR